MWKSRENKWSAVFAAGEQVQGIFIKIYYCNEKVHK